jgi:hypothetical protein
MIDLEDIRQERAIAKWRTHAQSPQYQRRSAHNAEVNAWRKSNTYNRYVLELEQRRDKYGQLIDYTEYVSDKSPSPEELLIQKQSRAELRARLGHHWPLVLALYAGYQKQEVARQLSISNSLLSLRLKSVRGIVRRVL